jgi:preprotein translocase subunit SecG
MITILILLFLITCFLLMVVVLLQAGKGGGLAAGFGGSGTGFELLGGRQTATFLHQGTRWLGGLFLVLAFLIALLTARQNRPASLIERELQGEPQPVQEEAGTPQDLESVIDQKPAEQGAGEGAAGDGGQGQTGAPAGAPSDTPAENPGPAESPTPAPASP